MSILIPHTVCVYCCAEATTYVCQHIVESLQTGEPVGFLIEGVEDWDEVVDLAHCVPCRKLVMKRGLSDGDGRAELERRVGYTPVCAICYDKAKRTCPERCEACAYLGLESQGSGSREMQPVAAKAWCTLRQVSVEVPERTYCKNFTSALHPLRPDVDRHPRDEIRAFGLPDKNGPITHIPWYADTAPLVSVPATCAICGRRRKNGITVQHGNQPQGFCSNQHYVKWWEFINHSKFHSGWYSQYHYKYSQI